MALTESDLVRYKRQISYPGFGEEGQKKLREADVVVAGTGGLGCAALTYLACAGIGHMTIVDSDWVELSNLNRQFLHWQKDIGRKKTTSAARKLVEINPRLHLSTFAKPITMENAPEIVRGANVVLDGMDNIEARLALNAACVAQRIPFVHAGVYGLMGEATTIIPGKTPCLACVLPRTHRSQTNIPVFGVTPGIMAMIQAAEAIKIIAGFGELLTNRMLYVDLERSAFSFANITRRADCRVCADAA